MILTPLCATMVVLYSKHRQTSPTCLCGDVTRSRGNKMDSDCEAQGYPRNFYITSPLFHSHLLTITNQIGQIQSGTSGGCVKAVQCRRRVLPASEEYSYIITSRAPPTCTPPACGAGAWCRPSCSRGTPGDSPAPGPGWAAPRHPPPAAGTPPHTRCRSSCLDNCGLDT